MRLLNLPEITTDAQNERFYTMALNAKRMGRERNLSQLETALKYRSGLGRILRKYGK